eukprot:sb/3465526/
MIDEPDDETLTKIIISNQIAIDRILQTKKKNDKLIGRVVLGPPLALDSVILRDGRVLRRSAPYKSYDDDVINASSSDDPLGLKETDNTGPPTPVVNVSTDPLGLKGPFKEPIPPSLVVNVSSDPLGLKEDPLALKETRSRGQVPSTGNQKSANVATKSVTDKSSVPSGAAEKRTTRSKSMPGKSPAKGPVKRKRELSLSLLADDKKEEGECSPVAPESIKLKCWENCSFGDVIFNLNSFMAHLNCTHGTPSHDSLPSHQQIVCTCSVCEAVVLYNYEHKDTHVKRCPSSAGLAQFFLFLENNRDNFGVPHFNAPMLKSQGVSVSEQFSINCKHSEVDTILWRTADNVLFFYHYCQPCNHFLSDRKSEVVAHLESQLHRMNMSKRNSIHK